MRADRGEVCETGKSLEYEQRRSFSRNHIPVSRLLYQFGKRYQQDEIKSVHDFMTFLSSSGTEKLPHRIRDLISESISHVHN